MPEQRYSIGQDLKEAAVMVEVLVPYVYEDTLYRRIGGGRIFSRTNMPYMTLGAVLLRLRRLRALDEHLNRDQKQQLRLLEKENQQARREWRRHYEDKLVQEAGSRLKMMYAFFAECRESPRLCEGAYMPEALRRTIVQENVIALDEMGAFSQELDRQIEHVNTGLRRYVRPSDFIWSEILQPAYPEEVFWWLYSKPQSPD